MKFVNTGRCCNELKRTDGGTLYIKKSAKYPIFTEYANGREKSIGRDKERVQILARRKYISLMIQNLEANYKMLRKFSMDLQAVNNKFDVGPMVNQFTELGFDMDKVFFSKTERQWLASNPKTNNFYEEHLEHITDSGIIMRSKSERNIGNRLELWRIPYIYEFPLRLRYKTYYPDFTIRKPNGNLIYWEHFGKMDEDSYFKRNTEKLREYRQQGLSEHTNLIITWENDLHDMELVDQIIRTRICS